MSQSPGTRAALDECIHQLKERSLARIETCFGQLSDEEIWHRPNENVVSVGNLILHLCGNVTQWVITTFTDEPDNRVRDLEFSTTGPIPKEELLAKITGVVDRACQVIDGLTDEQWAAPCSVQGTKQTGASTVIHVVEHFSYHTGQITLHTKLAKNVDLQYYGGQDLNITAP